MIRDMTIIVFGANGGVGAALVAALRADHSAEPVFAVSRSCVPGARVSGARVSGSGASGSGVSGPDASGNDASGNDASGYGPQTITIDAYDDTSLAALAAHIAPTGASGLTLCICAVGMLSNGGDVQPERSYRQQSRTAFEQIFDANVIIPALIAKHMLPVMPRDRRAVFAALSARVGSISDNRLGGWHAYRASKSALNMLIKNYAIEEARRNKSFVAVGLHPGTVDTDLSKPFQRGVPPQKLFTPGQSARYLLDVLDGLGPDDSGKVFDWSGEEVPA